MDMDDEKRGRCADIPSLIATLMAKKWRFYCVSRNVSQKMTLSHFSLKPLFVTNRGHKKGELELD